MLNRVERGMERLQSRMGGLESRMGGLESRMGGLESRIEGLEVRGGQLESDPLASEPSQRLENSEGSCFSNCLKWYVQNDSSSRYCFILFSPMISLRSGGAASNDQVKTCALCCLFT